MEAVVDWIWRAFTILASLLGFESWITTTPLSPTYRWFQRLKIIIIIMFLKG